MAANWDKLKTSKKEVKRAVSLLLQFMEEGIKYNNTEKSLAVIKAYKTLANFRSSYRYPLQSMINYFRNKATSVYRKAIVVRRLKRSPSILSKLRRNGSGGILTMGDVGGIRIVVDTLAQVYKVRDAIKSGDTKNTLVKEYDYVKVRKTSGYRSFHMVYSYQGDKEAYRDYRIELQIRSQVQHSWATAVEVVGLLNGENLKASDGDQGWLRFFQLAGIAFQDIENKKLRENKGTQDRIDLIKIMNTLQVVDKLRAYSFGTSVLEKEKKDYFLLELNVSEKKLLVRGYSEDFLDAAIDHYRQSEGDNEGDREKDVVLVAAESVKALKKAYPNYFADTKYFVENLRKLIKVGGESKLKV